jgi:hypothetical protein
MLTKQEYLKVVEQLNTIVCVEGHSISGRTPSEIWWTLGLGFLDVDASDNVDTIGKSWVQTWWDARDSMGNHLPNESDKVNFIGEAECNNSIVAMTNAVNELLRITQEKAEKVLTRQKELAKESAQEDPIVEMNGKRYKLVEID